MWTYITYLYTKFHLWKSVNKVHIDQLPKIDNQSVILIGNHFSLWDGFLALYLNHKFWKKDFSFLINQKGFEEKSILKKIGGISLSKKPKILIKQIAEIKTNAAKKNQLVLHFPQNQFESVNIERPNFKKDILKRIYTNQKIIFFQNIIEFEDHFKPSFYLYFQEVDVDTDLNVVYRKIITEHQHKIAKRHSI